MDELFMRKSWNVVMRLGRVDAVIVVGDMLDWGRGVMSDQEWVIFLLILAFDELTVDRFDRSINR